MRKEINEREKNIRTIRKNDETEMLGLTKLTKLDWPRKREKNTNHQNKKTKEGLSLPTS